MTTQTILPGTSGGRSNALLSLIGHTPLVPLRFEPEGLTVYAKCEHLNPSGSIKDRFASYVILDARKRGLIKPGSIILECTSGNTGIALATVARVLGYGCAIVMSESASAERRRLIQHMGAELVLFEAGKTYARGIEITQKMAAEDPRYFLPRQFENPLNLEEHELETGPEILAQMPEGVDAFVSGYGTGGTLAGVGRAIKARHPAARIVAMEPGAGAQGCGCECSCCFCIEGVAERFVPALVRQAPIDQRISVSGSDALAMTRRLHLEFGLMVGSSSGANMCAALQVAREMGPNARVVTLLCDRADRYFSTALFEK